MANQSQFWMDRILPVSSQGLVFASARVRLPLRILSSSSRTIQGGFDPSKTDFDWPEITQICPLELKLRFCGIILPSKYPIWEDHPYFISPTELYLTQVFFFPLLFIFFLFFIFFTDRSQNSIQDVAILQKFQWRSFL